MRSTTLLIEVTTEDILAGDQGSTDHNAIAIAARRALQDTEMEGMTVIVDNSFLTVDPLPAGQDHNTTETMNTMPEIQVFLSNGAKEWMRDYDRIMRHPENLTTDYLQRTVKPIHLVLDEPENILRTATERCSP